MYSQKIVLLGTGHGVGVRNAGTLSTQREQSVSTSKDIDNSKGTINAQRLDVNAQSLASCDGALEQTGAQALTVRAAHITNRDGGRIGVVATTTDLASSPALGEVPMPPSGMSSSF